MFATQETSPYDIAVVSLEEELEGVPVPVPTEHFYEGKGPRGPLLRVDLRKESQCSNPADQVASPTGQPPSLSCWK